MNGASRRKSTELLHVTLSTGDIRTSPLVDGYRLTASETGELLAFEIWPRPELDSLPLVRCTVARPGEGGAAAWSARRPRRRGRRRRAAGFRGRRIGQPRGSLCVLS